MKKVVFLSAIFFWMFGALARADGEAVFGLDWGMTPDEIEETGLYLTMKKMANDLYVYQADSLPKNIKDVRYYILVFDANKKLVKIIMVGQTITDDPSGEKGITRFAEIASHLSQKYEETDSITRTGIKIYNEEDEFYQCLAYKGCGLWVKMFRAHNKNIVIQLNGLEKGQGYIDITVEAVPEWDRATGKRPPLNVVPAADAL